VSDNLMAVRTAAPPERRFGVALTFPRNCRWPMSLATWRQPFRWQAPCRDRRALAATHA
jgi:hypothetical protein